MPLSLNQKAQIRRHLKFAVAGLPRTSPISGSAFGSFAGFRWAQAWGMLEWILNNMESSEEAILLGNGYGGVALVGPLVNGAGLPIPQPGDSVTITFSGGGLVGNHSVTAVAQADDTLISLCSRIAVAIDQDPTMTAAGFLSIAPFGTGAFSQNYIPIPQWVGNPAANGSIPMPEVSIQNPAAFTIVSAVSTSDLGAVITADGSQQPPYAPVDWTVTPYGTVWGFLPICNALEGSVYGASQNLSVTNAGGDLGVSFRMDEVRERRKLYTQACMDIATFLFGLKDENGLPGSRPSGMTGGATRLGGI